MPIGSPISRQKARTPIASARSHRANAAPNSSAIALCGISAIKRAGPGMDAEQHLAVVQGGKAENECRDAQGRDEADGEAVAREQAGAGLRPGIGGIGFGARDRQRLAAH